LEIWQSVGGPIFILSTCINAISIRFVSQCNEMQLLLENHLLNSLKSKKTEDLKLTPSKEISRNQGIILPKLV
jgi:hypothetical protein